MTVKVFKKKITFPTYRILDEDPLPRFHIYYPYTGLNNFDNKPTNVSYESIVVENEFLRMLLIPSLGARMYDLYDKVNKTHVFHYNETIRPTMIALRGAWIATGIEFNCLHRPHHTVDNFSPVDYKIVKNRDGSITVYIGNINLLTNIYYVIGLTIRPSKQFLETNIKIYNNDTLRTRYYFWTNTAESVTDMSKIFIPGKYTQSGPYPIYKGVDVSWYKNCKYAVDAFVIDCEEDFFGYYDYKMDRGVVQYANHFQVPGKKRFTWGTSEDGLFWAPILSDKGIPYIELQSGRFRTQGIVEFIDPHFYEEWKEWWYPISKIRGITYANKDATLYIDKEKLNGKIKIFIGIYVTRTLPKAQVVIKMGNRTISRETTISPGNPFIETFTTDWKGKIEIEVLDRENRRIIYWNDREYRTKIDESVYLVPAEFSSQKESDISKEKSLEKMFVDALTEDKRNRIILAELKYKKILDNDKYFTNALCSLAILYYRKGMYDEAIKLLEKAVKINPSSEALHYYLGISYLKKQRFFDAEIEFWKSRLSMKFYSAATFHIASIKIREKKLKEASDILKDVIGRDSKNLRNLFLYTLVLRKLGSKEEAIKIAEKTLENFPFYYPLYSELLLATKNSNKYRKYSSEYKHLVYKNYQKILESVIPYLEVSQYDDAKELLSFSLEQKVDSPMIYYYLGYVLGKVGKNEEKIKYYNIGNSKKPDYVFPHRLLEEEILNDVIDATSSPKPMYYLGNLLFFLRRYKDAIEIWKKAKEKGLKYSILFRNLGYAYFNVYRDVKKSLEMYEKALDLDPLNYRLYLEYDEVCSWLGLNKRRIKRLKWASEKLKKDSLLAKLSSAYVDIGNYDKALKILTENTFTPAEGFYGYWNIYVEALVRKGAELIILGKIEEAIRCFSKALEYPRNLGVGAPYPPRRHEAIQRYWLGLSYNLLGEEEKAREIWKSVFIQENMSPIEKYYKGLILVRLGKEKEAEEFFNSTLSTFSRREKNLMNIRKEIPKEYFILLGYDKRLAFYRCYKATSYLGIYKKKEAIREFRKARRITKALGHYNWIYNLLLSKHFDMLFT